MQGYGEMAIGLGLTIGPALGSLLYKVRFRETTIVSAVVSL